MVDTPIVSESLQKTFRDNFPSQINSGRDLHVSDVITPIVDFSSSTAIAGLSVDYQQALSYGNAIEISVIGSASQDVTSTPGFYRITGNSSIAFNNNHEVKIQITDGSTAKILWSMGNLNNTGEARAQNQAVDYIVFVNTGETLQVVTNATNFTAFKGSARQVADISGTLVNPTGYTGE